MKNTANLILMGIIICWTGCKAQDNMLSWQSQKIKIDGNDSDWAGMPRYFSSDMQLFYDLRNDSNNLYLRFKAPDRMTQMHMLRAGFTLTFTIKAKPKITATIAFPKLPKGTHTKDYSQQWDTKGKDTFLKNKFLLLNNPATVQGFTYSKGEIPQENSNPNRISFAIDWNASNALIYELRIPLQEFYGSDYRFSEMKGNKMKLNAKINALERPEMRSERPSRDDDMSEEGIERPPRNEMHEGMGGPPGRHEYGENRMRMSSMQEQRSFTFKFVLSKGR